MEVEIFTLCDFAQDAQGKLTIVGTFDTLFVRDFPAIHPTCSVAARIRFQDVERGKHAMQLTILDPAGTNVAPPLQGEIDVQIPPGGKSSTFNFTIAINQLRLATLGTYVVKFFLDNRLLKELPLIVAQVPRNT